MPSESWHTKSEQSANGSPLKDSPKPRLVDLLSVSGISESLSDRWLTDAIPNMPGICYD